MSQNCAFVETWAGLLAQAIGQQDFGSNDLETKASSRTRQQFHEAIETFGVTSSHSISKVAKNGIAVALDGQGEGQESIGDIRGNLSKPGKVTSQCLIFRLCLVDVVKGFLEAVGSFQPGKVQKPCVPDQDIALAEIMGASVEQILLMHQGAPLSISQTGTHALANRFQAAREQFEHMELIYDQASVRQNRQYRIMIWCPHISTDCDYLRLQFFGHVGKIADDARLCAVSKQLDDLVTPNIGNHAAVLVEQVQFVDAQVIDFRRWISRRERFRKFVEQNANELLINSYLIGNAHKGPAQCFGLNVADQAFCHEVMFIHMGYRLKEGSATVTTAISLSQGDDPDMLSSDGLVQKKLWLDLMSVKLAMTTMSTTRATWM